MRQQFDSCSYEELTRCVHARIEWIREWQRFLADENSIGYGHIRATALMKIAINRFEIRRLLKMRRVLKKSGQKNWNTERLGGLI